MDEKQDSVIRQVKFDGADVFEVGCGYGSFTFEYLQCAGSILGIDTDRKAIDHLRKNWSGPHENGQAVFQEGEIVEFDLVGKEFDVVVFSNSF